MKSSSRYRTDITDKSMRKKLDKQARLDDMNRARDVKKVIKRKQKEVLDEISESTSSFGTKAVKGAKNKAQKAEKAQKAAEKSAERKEKSAGFLKSLSDGFDKIYDSSMSKLKETQAKVDSKLDAAEAERERKKSASSEGKQMKDIKKQNAKMLKKK